MSNAVLGGWKIDGIFQMRTGLPVTITDGGGQSLQATRSFERPNRVCDGGTGASGPNDTWLDINCFKRAPAGQFGDSGVGILRGPGYFNLDLGLSKNLYLDDKRYLTLKIEAFNALNHANFALQQGAVDISDPTSFGKVLNTFSAPYSAAWSAGSGPE